MSVVILLITLSTRLDHNYDNGDNFAATPPLISFNDLNLYSSSLYICQTDKVRYKGEHKLQQRKQMQEQHPNLHLNTLLAQHLSHNLVLRRRRMEYKEWREIASPLLAP